VSKKCAWLRHTWNLERPSQTFLNVGGELEPMFLAALSHSLASVADYLSPVELSRIEAES